MRRREEGNRSHHTKMQQRYSPQHRHIASHDDGWKGFRIAVPDSVGIPIPRSHIKHMHRQDADVSEENVKGTGVDLTRVTLSFLPKSGASHPRRNCSTSWSRRSRRPCSLSGECVGKRWCAGEDSGDAQTGQRAPGAPWHAWPRMRAAQHQCGE